MSEPAELDVYMAAIRAEVCSRCIERVPGAPPCDVQGKGCGIEQHLPKLVEICHSTSSCLVDCELQPTHNCPCPMSYLLPLAVEAIEAVDRRLATVLASDDLGAE